MNLPAAKTLNNSSLHQLIGRLALESMLIEVSVTPKPGLVDRNNSGAHKDMNFFTFMKSAAGLRNTFDEFAIAGINTTNPYELFPELRKIGIIAENFMFESTKGINTHKGEIFSLGILSACAGCLLAKNESLNNIFDLSSFVCKGLCESDFAGIKSKSPETLTKGEKAFIDYGITCIRGEAEAGYPIVKNYSLPALTQYLSQNLSINDALSFTLIHIIAKNFDTNIISRHDMKTLNQVMQKTNNMINSGFTMNDIIDLDYEFTQKNISPSGSADLLAVTYFIHSISHSGQDI